MAPADSKTTTKFVSTTNANSLKAAIFHTMAFKLSLEINTAKVTIPTKRSFLKALYKVCKTKKKPISFEQKARIHLDGPKIAICETTSDMVFVLNTTFTSNDDYFNMAIKEAGDAFNQALVHFGCNQKVEKYDPKVHRVNPPQPHPFFKKMDCHSKPTYSSCSFTSFSSSFSDDAVCEHVASLLLDLHTKR